jgi:hypothetical protein
MTGDHKEYRVIGGKLNDQTVRLTFEQFDREPGMLPTVTLYAGGVEPAPVEYVLREILVESEFGDFFARVSVLFYDQDENATWDAKRIAASAIGQALNFMEVRRS